MQCDKCQKEFSRVYSLRRHKQNSCTGETLNILTCDKCEKTFTRKDTLLRHNQKTCVAKCPIPRKRLRPIGTETLDSGISKLTCAFKNRISSYRFSSIKKMVDYTEFFSEIKPKVLSKLVEYLMQHNVLKVNLEVFGLYIKPENELSDIKSMNSANKIITESSNIDEIYNQFVEELLTQAQEFQEKDSGWTLQEIMFMDLNINKYSSISASSYIKLPKPISRKRAVLNIINQDNACFAWSVNSAIFPAEGDPTKPCSYPHYNTLLNFNGIEFPMKMKDISQFEVLNNISVNVFGLESAFKDGKMIYEVIGPLYFTSGRKATHVNLLFITNNDGAGHYCLITDMSRLVSRQISKHNGCLNICDGCLQNFKTSEDLRRHEENDCTHIYAKLPSNELKKNKCGEFYPENILKFNNYQKQEIHPFVIYADFESMLIPIHHAEPYDGKSFTTKVSQHQAYSFGLYLKCSYNDNLSKYIMYEGLDAPKMFIETLDKMVRDLYNNHLKHVRSMQPLTKEELNQYDHAIVCHICEKQFQPTNHKVRDHCHLTGKFRGAAHNSCNLHYKVPNYIPVFLHNMTNYDSHLFIQELTTKGENISVIAQTKEKYISFGKTILVEKSTNPKLKDSYIKMRFVDSYRFLASSLEKLAETLDSNQCNEVRKYFPNEDNFKLMRKKGVFPYCYVDNFEKLGDEQLPPKGAFFNTLKDEAVLDEEYERARTVWNTFQCQTLSDYAALYLKVDVLLLADIFENFRKVCLNNYKLDPAHYLTAPSLSWDAMLRHTQVKLQLLTDLDMVHFFKKGIRGGVATCIKRKALANNQFLSNYNSGKPTSYIMYLDATNMYGKSMSNFLPYGDFRWLTEDEIDAFDVESVEDNSSKGYVLEVDLEYPTSLHDAHNDLPFCPENIVPPKSKYPKLIPNLYDKRNYIIHYQNLKQCLEYGLKLKKIHRVIEFSQSQWLKPYVDLNTYLRNNAKNAFEKDLFKLLINAIFGKTMENIEKRKDIRLCSHWESRKGSLGARSLISKPQFKCCSVFNENLVAVHLNQVKLFYDKPLFVGFSILDISKTIIYDFFYGHIKQKYGDSTQLCYTDTDSLVLEIKTENFYRDMKQDIKFFDTSNYEIGNIYDIPKTESFIGKMKDEFAGVPIKSFVGTGAKAYAVELDAPFKNMIEIKKAKGVPKYVVQNQLEINDYVQIVETGGVIFRKMYVFVSDFHTIYTERKNKVALSAEDDKRYVIPGGVNTLAWGHFLLNPKSKTGDLDKLIQACQEITPDVHNKDLQLDLWNVNSVNDIDVNLDVYLSDLDLDCFNDFNV